MLHNGKTNMNGAVQAMISSIYFLFLYFHSEAIRKLPFDCCSISFRPFTNPVCSPDGNVFDLENIVPFLKKHKVDPVSGNALSSKDLIRLHYFKNAEGKYHCPVTFKIFNDNTHIIAIKPSGNVYCMEAIKELNIKPKIWTDLMTGEKFTRNDIISLQDPSRVETRDMDKFFHVLNTEEIKNEPHINLTPSSKLIIEKTKEKKTEINNIINTIKKGTKTKEEENKINLIAGTGNDINKTNQRMRIAQKLSRTTTFDTSGSVTCSVITPIMNNNKSLATEKQVNQYRWNKMQQLKEKGYVKFITNLGELNIEVECNLVPRTSENFMTLCENGYYNNTIFHRLIPKFMIQGGDPTGSGFGGESIWKKGFKNEFHPKLTHNGRGVLSMANSGGDCSNNSQFFITFQACHHLDNKHSIFGHLVGGLDTLNKMEQIETDKKDKPLIDIKILSTEVYVNPFLKLDDLVEKDLDKMNEKDEYLSPIPVVINKRNINVINNNKEIEEEEKKKKKKKRKIDVLKEDNDEEELQIGKYISKSNNNNNNNIDNNVKRNEDVIKSTNFTDFSSW